MSYLVDFLLFAAGVFVGFLLFRGHLKVRPRHLHPLPPPLAPSATVAPAP